MSSAPCTAHHCGRAHSCLLMSSAPCTAYHCGRADNCLLMSSASCTAYHCGRAHICLLMSSAPCTAYHCGRAHNCLLMSSAPCTAYIASRFGRTGLVKFLRSFRSVERCHLHNIYSCYIADINRSGEDDETVPEAIATDFLYVAVEIHDCLRYERYAHCRTYCPHKTTGHQWRTQEFFFWVGGFNKFSCGQRTERTGIWGHSPLVRGSGGSCDLVLEISFHIVKFS